MHRLTLDEVVALAAQAKSKAAHLCRLGTKPGQDLATTIYFEMCEGTWLALAAKLQTILDEWDTPTPCEECEGHEEEIDKLEARLRNTRQVCEDTPREPGDIESADIPSAFLDVLTGALDEIQEKATP